ncbi:endonuclease III domain-containing protein [Methanofollis aquaemaris]|uniref:endonuclease III domain-containing protein n=1 Tax=Methanofollis aquaemaris TaxID=126734 RepID=UPI00223F9346|nr:Fe-S cluster assembly protein HesB [Methanofollis aquaemaris]
MQELEGRYGAISWWEAPPEEVVIGAVLTQQTRWENVTRAIANLKEAGCCSVAGVVGTERETIEAAVRPTGFFRVKTERLKALCGRVEELGGVGALGAMPTVRLREELLAVRGVGEETADSILCYAFGRSAFVIDAYTRQVCRCMGITAADPELRRLFERALPEDAEAYARAHAWIVEYAKEYCRTERCEECRIRNLSE